MRIQRHTLLTTLAIGLSLLFGTARADAIPLDFTLELLPPGGVITAPAGATILIPPQNRPPLAVNDAATTTAGVAVNISLLANDSVHDGDPLTVTGFTQPGNGSATFASGVETYSPNTGFSGSNNFTYTIGDGRGGNGFSIYRRHGRRP